MRLERWALTTSYRKNFMIHYIKLECIVYMLSDRQCHPLGCVLEGPLSRHYEIRNHTRKKDSRSLQKPR